MLSIFKITCSVLTYASTYLKTQQKREILKWMWTRVNQPACASLQELITLFECICRLLFPGICRQPVISTPHCLKIPSRYIPFCPYTIPPFSSHQLCSTYSIKMLVLPLQSLLFYFILMWQVADWGVSLCFYNSRAKYQVFQHLELSEPPAVSHYLWNLLFFSVSCISYYSSHMRSMRFRPQRSTASSVHITDCTVILQIVTMDN